MLDQIVSTLLTAAIGAGVFIRLVAKEKHRREQILQYRYEEHLRKIREEEELERKKAEEMEKAKKEQANQARITAKPIGGIVPLPLSIAAESAS